MFQGILDRKDRIRKKMKCKEIENIIGNIEHALLFLIDYNNYESGKGADEQLQYARDSLSQLKEDIRYND